MTNPKARTPTEAARVAKSRPFPRIPSQQPKRPEDPYWRPEDVPQERSFAPVLTRAGLDWSGWSEERCGPMAERDGTPSFREELERR